MSIFHLKHEIYTRMAYHMPWLPPHRFVFVLTNQCNLSCEKCFQDRKYKKTILSKEQWIKLSDAIPGFSRITITGGEPLLFPGFGEIFGAIADRHECNLITNGTLLTEDLIDLLVSSAKFKVLAISIDDLKTGGTDIRRLSERQWDNLERMAGYFVRRRAQEGSDCSLEIKTLIIDGNAGRLFDIHRYCMEDIKADRHTFQFLKGTALQHSDEMYDMKKIFEDYDAPIYEDFAAIVKELGKIRDYNIANGKKAFLHPIVSDLNSSVALNDISFMNRTGFDKGMFEYCKFPWSSIHVNYDGELFPCLSVPIGNIKEKSVKQILRGQPYKNFLSVIRRSGTVGACNRCGWLRPIKNYKNTTENRQRCVSRER